MKAVAVVLSVLALLALGVDIEAKRIHQMRAALHAEDAVEADVLADADAEASLPFDGDYWTDGGRPELTKILASAAKGKPQNTAELLAKFFTADNILLAQQQGSTVTAAIGTYKAVAQTRSCNQGVCDDKWTPLDLQATTGTKTQGGEGIVRMTCTVPKDLATAKCTLEVFFGTANTVFFVCPDVGGAKPTCSVPTYQYASSTGSWYTSRFVTDVVDGADVYFNADSTTINWKWHGTYNNRLVFTGLIFYTSSYKTYKPTINPAQPGALPALTTAAKKPQLTTADLLKKFFTEDNIMLAQQQGANVYTTLGGYGSAAVTRTCNQGICSSWDKLDLLATTGTKTQGGEGVAKLQCTVPKDLTTAKCTLEVFFGTANTVMFVCPDVGGSGTKSCSVPTYQYASSTGSWYTSRFVTDVTEEFGVFFTADQTVIHWKWRGVYNTKLVGTDLTWFTTAPYKTYKPTINPPAPAPLPALVAAQKAKVLTTADLLEKFFTKDNIALAQMQGSSIPVRATIGAYKALSNSRTCNQGVCSEWTALDLLATTGTQTRGGEGSLALTCTVPKDLATAKCNLEAFIAGGSVVFFVCPDIGSGKATCSVPTYQYASSTGSWYTQRFVTDVTEFFGAYFTAEQLVINWKWRGVSNTKLVGTELTLYTTTPFVDFATPLKTNCLSKTTVDAVMKAASAKLKNKITLTTTAVDALIKSAPYTTVQQAIDKIKGIGPVNVVYVSFMWNFQC